MKLDIKNYVDEKFPVTRESTRSANLSAFSKAMGIDIKTAQSLYDGNAERIYLDTLDKLCDVLDCNASDILIRETPEPQPAINLHKAGVRINSDFATNEQELPPKYLEAIAKYSSKLERTAKEIEEQRLMIEKIQANANKGISDVISTKGVPKKKRKAFGVKVVPNQA